MPTLRNVLAGLAAASMAIIPFAAAPAMASDPDNVMPLVNAITATGTRLYTDCPDGAGFSGVYISGQRAMAVCSGGDMPTQFNEEEQDTLRHEGIHLAQDCMDRSFNSELETVRTIHSVISLMAEASSVYNFQAIENIYRQQGADDQTILLEFEAWASAAVMTNAEVAALITRVCRVA